MAKRRNRMTRAELLEELRRHDAGEVAEAMRRSIFQLQVFREEVTQQNEELIDAQRRLERARDRFADLYDSAPVGYLTVDASGVVEEINLTGARLLGQERERIVGNPLLFAVAERRVFLEHLSRCRRGDASVVSEITLRARGARLLPVEMRSHRVQSEGRALFRTTLTDLSERRRAEAERNELALREQVAREANEAKDRFLAILSHELRGPLAAISAAANLLEEEPALPAPLRDSVERILRNTAAEARLITDLLDASRLRYRKLRVERKPVDLHVVVEDAIAALRSESPGIAIELALEAARPVVKGDRTRLGQVLSNLLRNAREATAKGGEIRVVTSNPTPERTVLSVIDTGCGIERDELNRIFNPFEQGEPGSRGDGGLGLGLAITKGLVEAHGGGIQADSAGRGMGARFDVELPASAEPVAERVDPEPEPQTHRLRVLLVDDDLDSLELVARLLEHRGLQVMVADSVASALARAEQGFDVLVSDLALPDGTGHDLARQLASKGPLRAIALSGYSGDEDLRAGRDAGFRAHLVKPVDPSNLVRTIARVAAA
jgi:PAS domain S-box-containing protein